MKVSLTQNGEIVTLLFEGKESFEVTCYTCDLLSNVLLMQRPGQYGAARDKMRKDLLDAMYIKHMEMGEAIRKIIDNNIQAK